jgi:hypothetical protein
MPFKIGDMVREKLPSGSSEIGIVIEHHILSGEQRFVVKFNNGEEGVFFADELMPDQRT